MSVTAATSTELWRMSATDLAAAITRRLLLKAVIRQPVNVTSEVTYEQRQY
jgi:hypothetical protein